MLAADDIEGLVSRSETWRVELDCRERLSDETRWSDRVAAHDPDWSGNIVDFYFRICNRIISDIKVPFKLNPQGVSGPLNVVKPNSQKGSI